jgi:serine protease Do
MNRIKRVLAVMALGGVGTASWFVGSGLVKNVQFARALEQVEVAREQLARAEDLAGVFRTVGKAVEPSVVYIRVTKKEQADDRMSEMRRMFPDDELFRRFFPDRDGDGQPDMPEGHGEDGNVMQGQGSGVIVEADGSTGWIVTNNHVAGNADDIRVTLADGREIRNAKLVGADPKTDLAVIKIDADRLIAAKWGDSREMQKGDFVLAFGAPFGMVGSMTHGIVSGFNRQTGILGQFGYEDFLQTDCPINPGNSGGPLVNLKGEIIGINSAILTRNGAFQGVGFAIPSNQAKSIYQSLKQSGRVTRGYLGVSIFDANKARELAEQMGITRDGVVVSEVRDAPALGKLEPADVITRIDGKEIKTVQDLRTIVAQTAPGTETTFSVIRNGKEIEVKLKIAEQPDDLVASAGRARDRADRGGAAERTSAEKLGLTLTDPTDEVLSRYGVEGEKGAVVTRVSPDGPARAAGVRPGDVITRIGDREISNADEALDALSKLGDAKGIGLHVASKEGKRFVFVPLTRGGR